MFELTEDETLSIYADNVDILRFVVEKMEFDEVDIEAMHSVFDDASEGDPQRLSKQAFAQSVERLMPRGRFTSDTKVVLSRSLDGIFEAFDRAQMGFVDLKEFASAFSNQHVEVGTINLHLEFTEINYREPPGSTITRCPCRQRVRAALHLILVSALLRPQTSSLQGGSASTGYLACCIDG